MWVMCEVSGEIPKLYYKSPTHFVTYTGVRLVVVCVYDATFPINISVLFVKESGEIIKLTNVM